MLKMLLGGAPVARRFNVSQRVLGFGKCAFVISVGIGGHTGGKIGRLYSIKRLLVSLAGAKSLSVCC